MTRVPCELALARVIDYLARCGVPPTRAVMRRALRLVEEVLAQHEDNVNAPVGEALVERLDEGRDERGGMLADAEVAALIAQTMMRLPQHFVLPAPPLPEACPPLRRGSIGYEPW